MDSGLLHSGRFTHSRKAISAKGIHRSSKHSNHAPLRHYHQGELPMNAAVAEVLNGVGHSARYARVIALSKRTEWQIDRDLLRGRTFDFSRKFLPDGLTLSHRLAFFVGRRCAPDESGAGPDLRLHFWAGGALHQREDARPGHAPRYLATSSHWKAWCASLTRRSSTRICSGGWRR